MTTEPNTNAVVEEYLRDVEAAFKSKDVSSIESLFMPNGYLRDLLITSWDFASVARSELKELFTEKNIPDISGLKACDGSGRAHSGPVYVEATGWIQGFFTFHTPIAQGIGMFRLLKDSSDSELTKWKALTLSLTMSSLSQYPEIARHNRPHGVTRGTESWLDLRNAQSSFSRDSPKVIIVGAGHSGLMLAARLKRLGVSSLMIAREKRLGDNWRLRYKSLVLHDPIWADYFPYLKYPDDWPIYIPKDKMAGWQESYADIMELNVWLESSVVPDSTSYDESSGTWSISIRKNDGSIQEMKCSHLVQATGASGEPNIPSFPGTENFKGVITHSSGHKGGEGWEGKKAIVIGCCNSAHDIAEEFHRVGADVTIVQRSSTLIISSENGIMPLLSPAYTEDGPSTEEADLGTVSFPITASSPYLAAIHKMTSKADKELLDGLARAGFKVNEDPCGLLVKYWRDGGGYYINVGCSELIVDGKVKVKQGQEVEKFEENGVRFKDGTFLPADIVVLATGYQSMRETAKKIFGEKVADRTGKVWGFDKQGEIQGIWRSSGHPGFWYHGGNLVLSRIYSQYLALQIKAQEVGLASKK